MGKSFRERGTKTAASPVSKKHSKNFETHANSYVKMKNASLADFQELEDYDYDLDYYEVKKSTKRSNSFRDVDDL